MEYVSQWTMKNNIKVLIDYPQFKFMSHPLMYGVSYASHVMITAEIFVLAIVPPLYT